MLSEKVKKVYEENKNSLPAYAWPGGYPIYYVTSYNNIVCPECANKMIKDEYEDITDYDINWEDNKMFCEGGCKIESAYGEDNEE